ncbi:AcrR family transcriptional regulator [Rhodoblastus acidophilus]|uniref:CerR family C-terminal domain-containing protein n=1 Tax=Rhodoblastus acidophilus TaxID=1074 RepID=UPI002224D0F6|nr:CerR family C-terminal domain-containing protein [Rhodoblastus acidophilus]MCW2318568.1 AcrR family transcriptional regulator [Rhodoblastus acidophilus]
MASNSTSPSGHDARSAKTREHLIDAAIDVIGAIGYDAATTRMIANAAGANLSAIPYHFGGKKELYLAAAQKIADYARGRFGEITQLLLQPTGGDAAARFEKALVHLLHIMLEQAEPHSWTSFVARCTYDNDEAFGIIYENAIAMLLDELTAAAKTISVRTADEATLRLRVSAILTSIVGFRFQRGITLRSMNWENIQGAYATQIETMLRDLCKSDFLHTA